MTYGQIRLRLSQLSPGTSLEILDGFIQDRYTQALDMLPWKRLEGEQIYQVPQSVNAGTVAVTQGSNVVTGTGTSWTSGQFSVNGSLFLRINNNEEYYYPTFVNGTEITLDRGYEQASGTGLSYRVDQPIFQLPAAARVVRGVRQFHPPRNFNGPRLLSPGQLNSIAPGRLTYGIPRYAASAWDSNSNPPVLQVELYPIPDCPSPTGDILSFAVDMIQDAAALNPSAIGNGQGTSFSMLPWVRPAALIAGVLADLATGSEAVRLEAKFAGLVKQMSMINALQRGPQAIRLAPEYRGVKGGHPGFHIGKHADQDYFAEDDYDL